MLANVQLNSAYKKVSPLSLLLTVRPHLVMNDRNYSIVRPMILLREPQLVDILRQPRVGLFLDKDPLLQFSDTLQKRKDIMPNTRR